MTATATDTKNKTLYFNNDSWSLTGPQYEILTSLPYNEKSDGTRAYVLTKETVLTLRLVGEGWQYQGMGIRVLSETIQASQTGDDKELSITLTSEATTNSTAQYEILTEMVDGSQTQNFTFNIDIQV